MADAAYVQKAIRIRNACGLFLIIYTLLAASYSITTGNTLLLSWHPDLPVMAGTILVCTVFITASLLTVWIQTIPELIVFAVSIVWSLSICLMNVYLRLVHSEFDLEFLFGLQRSSEMHMSLLSTFVIILIHWVTIAVAFDFAGTEKLTRYAFRSVVFLTIVVQFVQLLSINSDLSVNDNLLISLPEAAIYVGVLYVLKIIFKLKNKRPKRALVF